MPRSKRNKVVSLTKTASKGKTLKTKLVETLRQALDEYEYVYVLRFDNMRAALFKDVRMHWKESRIFLGKNTIAQIALGRTPEQEYKDNLRHISAQLEGNVGLLFTSRPPAEVKKYFKKYSAFDYAKAGAIPNENIVLNVGELSFPPTMLDQLRKLGLVAEIDNGKVMLREEFAAATKGTALTPEQCKLLTLMKMPLVRFKIDLVSSWHDGQFSEL